MKSLENKHSNNFNWCEPKVEDKYIFTSDNFVIEKQPKLIKDCRSCKNQENCWAIDITDFKCWQPIGNTEQFSSSEKPNNLKTKLCIICNEPTPGGTLCGKLVCYDEFEKL